LKKYSAIGNYKKYFDDFFLFFAIFDDVPFDEVTHPPTYLVRNSNDTTAASAGLLLLKRKLICRINFVHKSKQFPFQVLHTTFTLHYRTDRLFD
jgi:hypothetical protein